MTSVRTMAFLLIALAVCFAAAVCLAVLYAQARAKAQADDEKHGDLSAETARLLASLNCESIVVDDSDDIVRASSAVYRLGLVRNDTIADERLRELIIAARKTGEMQRFDIVTQTAQDFVTAQTLDADARNIADPAAPGVVSDFESTPRPNWLSGIVTPLNSKLTLVLVEDESEQRRFAEIRDDFVSNVTVQLGEPVDQIEKLSAQLNDPQTPVDEIRANAATLEHQSHYLRHLVADLVLLLQAQKRVEPTPSNRLCLDSIVDQVAASEADRLAEAKVSLKVNHDDVPTYVHGDASQLTAALTKLVENAIEFSPDGSHVTVAVGPDATGRYASLRVVDNGPGIAANDQSRIFRRFYRGSDEGRFHGGDDGTGLGLSIVKHVALTHQGTVKVWSKRGQGSTFTILIPLCNDGDDDAQSDAGRDVSHQTPMAVVSSVSAAM